MSDFVPMDQHRVVGVRPSVGVVVYGAVWRLGVVGALLVVLEKALGAVL
jgi:hypothetical protein